ncbi:MAG: 5'-3' exonuclease H3TH domain-containing protein [Pirellulales bacterium]
MAKTTRQGIFPGMDPETSPDEAAPPRARAKVSAAKPIAANHSAVKNRPAPAPASSAPDGDAPPRPRTLAGNSVWVVDANSLIFQVFHALPEMTSPQGEPVSAVFGFTRDMLYLLEQKKPDYLFVAFDGPERTFRHEIYDDYKAHRDEMPVDLVPQYEPIRRLLAGLGVPVLEYESYEADDLLATIAHETGELEGECYLVTADKDARQLISDRVKVYNVRKDQVYDAQALKEDWGVRPEQVVDFQALVGDAVDNVPGVPLIGPKMAGEYLQKFDTLDALLARAEELPKGKRKDNLIAMKDQALLSRELVRLERHVPVKIDWNAAKVGLLDRAALEELFVELGFHGFARKFSSLPEKKQNEAVNVDYQLINTPNRRAWLVEQLGLQKAVSLDTETTSIHPRFAEIVGYSFAWNDRQAYYLPVRAPAGETHLDPDETLAALRPILENPAIEIQVQKEFSE